jgi:hypothetical protein
MFIWFSEGHVYTALTDLTGVSIIAVVSVVTLSKSVKKKMAKAMSSNLLILFCKFFVYSKTTKNLRQKGRFAIRNVLQFG